MPADAGPPTATPPAVEEPTRLVVSEDEAAPEGPACTADAHCGQGLACRGAPGCHAPWACGAARACMEESVSYCDCEGQTFQASGGCPGRPYAHVGACEAEGTLVADGTELGVPDWDQPQVQDERACTTGDDCRAGQVCWGVPGCGTAWSCIRARGCRRDSVPYCGCDGVTFRASSTCPGRPFVYRGACREAVASAMGGGPLFPSTATASHAPTSIGAAAPPNPSVEVSTAGGPIEPTAPSRVDRARARVEAQRLARDARAVARDARAAARDAQRALETAAHASEPVADAPRGCSSNRSCRRGEVCQGVAGCGEEIVWQCGPPVRPCVTDTQVFCDCEGHDFRASMFCPARPYRHRGSCELDRSLELSGATLR